MTPEVLSRVLASSVKNDQTGCIEWSQCLTRDGYGKTKVNQKTVLTHRVVWAATHGPIPSGMLVCHKCDNPKCVNVDHLFLGTPKDNMVDKVSKGRWRGGPACWTTVRGNAKLDASKVRQIKQMIVSGRQLCRIAGEFGVTPTTIGAIKSGAIWKHVQEVA